MKNKLRIKVYIIWTLHYYIAAQHKASAKHLMYNITIYNTLYGNQTQFLSWSFISEHFLYISEKNSSRTECELKYNGAFW